MWQIRYFPGRHEAFAAEAYLYKGGHIYWDGTDILPWPEEKLNTLRGSDMAMVFQDPMTALNPVLTIGRSDYRRHPY